MGNNVSNDFQTPSCELPKGAARIHSSQLIPDRGTYDVLVLNARLRPSLVTVRSLGGRGLRVAALETSDALPAPTFSSRWCRYKAVCPAHEGTKDYLRYLECVLDSTGARVLIASSDGTIALMRQHREQLEQRVRIALAKEPALAIAVSKERTLEVARRLGLGVPRGITIGDVSEVGAALREIGLPAVVKPVESWAWGEQRRVISQLVTTPDEARRAVEELTCFGGKVLFQKFLSGRRESLSFFYADGQMYARFAQWAKRTDPPLGGIIVLRQAVAFPSDTGEQAERLVREIDLEGYSEVEFRRDSAGHPYLMEINPRLNASIEVAVRAGIDFPYLLYQWANGERIDVVKGYRVGGWMRHLGGDIATTLASVRQRGRPGVTPPARAILEFCASFFVPMRYDYLDWSDPLPALAATIGFPRYLLRQGGKKPSQKRGGL
jgi:predicted ATP-grasp superfamily ATP-dependent carboligase